ncbi:hypothetical protein CDL15_Pgr004441 [Punica granatum]|uniref:O-fucosyltransferase family protein n=1 Tax=Punica granatum TaxID=22663 RepID=A0A218XGX8_PUNGR|nr:hypothetical protein CDL15_Pgr004441 [Punica granatum]
MKKKKREVSGSVHHLLLRAKLFHRCRLHGPITGLLPLISAVSGCLLLLFALLSLLSPSPSSGHGRRHVSLLRHHSSLSSGRLRDELEAESISSPRAVFHVPSSGGSLSRDLWSSRLSSFFHGCSNASSRFLNLFLVRKVTYGQILEYIWITDAVAAAYILNATLVVPKLDRKSFWKDASNFNDIFDVDWFISFLSKDVEIIKQLPEKGGKAWTPHTMRVPRKCTPKCYQTRVLPVLNKKHAVQLGKFDYRLSNRLEKDLQKLRCRVNYHALKFTDSIRDMGKTLVERMRSKSNHFIALHLRFEPDMLAFSGCYYGGGEREREELGAIRKRWKTLHKSNPEKERRHGRCPLTPEEVGLMLRALGFGSDVHLYVASGEVYGGEETLAPLKALFPNFHTKETIATKAELVPFSLYSSRMAALDFIVCDESSVFVTNNNGNMARILAGRRRYFGHKPTIRPNAKKLYKLFMNRTSMTWEEFTSRVRTHQIGFMGDPNEVRPGRGEFHENPSACICESPEAKDMVPHREIPGVEQEDNNSQNSTAELTTEDDQGLSDTEDIENGNNDAAVRRQSNSLQSETLKSEQPELEEIFSD